MLAWIIFLYVLGLALICLEVFLPGGIVGLFGGCAMVASFVIAFTRRSAEFGAAFLGVGLIVLIVALFICIHYMPRTRMAKTLFLQTTQKGSSGTAQAKLEKLVGQTGTTLSYLRPSGITSIGGSRINAVTEGVFIKKGSQVKVVRAEGSQVVVREIDGPS